MSRTMSQNWIKIDPYPTGRRNHGQPWSAGHIAKLKAMWDDMSYTKEFICQELGRSRLAVAMKAETIGLVEYDPINEMYRSKRAMVTSNTSINSAQHTYSVPNTSRAGDIFPTAQILTASSIQGVDLMSNIETKTYIKGADASTMTDSQIFSRIAGIEQEIDKLKAIRVQSEKLTSTIKNLEADVNALAAYVDGR